MAVPDGFFDGFQALYVRFAEKEYSRRADAADLLSGRKTQPQLKRENEVFAFPASRARINLSSARSLS